MKVVLVRHGQAEAGWNQNPDPGLSALGQQQAREFALMAAEMATPSVCILSSPLQRARQTAEPLAEALNRPIQTASAFTEIPSPQHIALQDRLSWLMSCRDAVWPDMCDESVLAWRQGVLQALDALPPDSWVFSHFMVMNVVAGALSQSERLVSYQPDYCSMLTLQRTGEGWQVQSRGRQSVSRVL